MFGEFLFLFTFTECELVGNSIFVIGVVFDILYIVCDMCVYCALTYLVHLGMYIRIIVWYRSVEESLFLLWHMSIRGSSFCMIWYTFFLSNDEHREQECRDMHGYCCHAGLCRPLCLSLYCYRQKHNQVTTFFIS